MKNTITFIKNMTLTGVVLGFLASCATQPPPAPQQESFATPADAVDALVAASRADDKAKLLGILGPRGEKLVSSGDPVADADARQKFVEAYDRYHRLDIDSDASEVLVVGDQGWPLPIPVVRKNDKWMFDTAAGEEAILDRRIGRNELDVIEVCREFVYAEREYAKLYKREHGFAAYAQRINSTPGRHDGLFWPAGADGVESPLGSLIADAQEEGYDSLHGRNSPYHGYYFRILKQQGPSAAGGKKDYVVDGHMTRGFALLAFPARYGDSGVKSFIVSRNGIVYEQDLGPDTEARAAAVKIFNPDADWTPSP